MDRKRQASIALIVILIACTIAIVAFVMSNGSTPVGPAVPSGGSSLDIEVQGTVVVDDVEVINYWDANICVTPVAGVIANTGLCTNVSIVGDITAGDDITVGDRLNLTTVDQEYLDITGAATIFVSTRDSVVFMLDSNNNTPGADLCIQRNGVTTDVVCVDKNGNITGATLDCDLNTCVDFPGGTLLGAGLPIPDGSTPATTIYQGIPGVSGASTGGGAFVIANDIYYEPFNLTEEIIVNRLSILVTSAGNPGDGCRIGIYKSDEEWQATDLVVDAGQVINDSLGWKHTTTNLPVLLTPGTYLNVLICNTGPGLGDHGSSASYVSGLISTGTTSATRFMGFIRDSAPTGTPYSSGFANPGDSPWDTIDLSTGHYFRYVTMRWSVN